MAMTIIWTGMVVLSVLCGLATGRGPAVAAAAMEGAAAGVELCLSMAGVLCLWMGVMEVMKRSGLSDKLSRLLMPVLRRLYPAFARDREVMDTISANVSANLLGLGNAATPLGLEAARKMSRKTPGVASECWWCATRPPSNSFPPPWRRYGPGRDVRRPSIFCPPSGWPPPSRSRWGSWPPSYFPKFGGRG